MKFVTTTALALALGAVTLTMGASPALAKKKEEAPAAGKSNFSPDFVKAAQPLQTAIQAKDWATAKSALPAALAAASTDDDKYQGNLMALIIAQNTNDTAAQLPAANAIIASGKAPPEQLQQILTLKGQLAYNSGDLAGADQSFTQLAQMKPNDPDTAALLAQTKVREGKGADALPVIDKAIEAQRASGQPVSEDWYRRALAIAYDSKPPIPAGVIKYGQALVAAYPSPETWRTAIQTYRNAVNPDPQTDLDAMRLARITHGLAGERDYYDYANSALNKGFPGEAAAVINEGVSSNMVDSKAIANSKALSDIKAVAAPKVAADKASLPALATKAKAASDPKLALNTADAFYGYGQFQNAVDLYKVAQQKGADANLVNLRIGMALAQLGQKDAADQAFASVTGPRQSLAGYWKVWNDGARGTGAPAARGAN